MVILVLRDALTTAKVSFIILLSAGSFIFIALSELIPEALIRPLGATGVGEGKHAVQGDMRKILSFVAGAVVIGIPLIFDQHCEPNGHDH